jgi:hypothetical protein
MNIIYNDKTVFYLKNRDNLPKELNLNIHELIKRKQKNNKFIDSYRVSTSNKQYFIMGYCEDNYFICQFIRLDNKQQDNNDLHLTNHKKYREYLEGL